MKLSRRQVITSGGAWALLPVTACGGFRPVAGSPEGHTARPEPGQTASKASTAASPAESTAGPPSAGGAAEPGPSSPDRAAAHGQALSHEPVASRDAPATSAASSPGALTCERLVAKIGRNHGHDFPIAATDVPKLTSKVFNLRGSSDHTHTVELSASELAALCRGEVVRKQTERGGTNAHRHRVLLRCEPLVLPPQMISACAIVIAGQDDHELVIPESHVRAGTERQYDIQGVAGHTHVLTVTAADFARIVAGEKVDLKSGQGLGHFHHVYIRYPLA